MRRIKLVLIVTAIVISVCTAFATRPPGCEDYPQYYKSGSAYYPAGDFGYDYICWNLPGICTYYKPNPLIETYYACRLGVFEAIPHVAKK